jgi:hypothetical protein
MLPANFDGRANHVMFGSNQINPALSAAYTSQGGETLASLTANREVFLVFLRHFGCTFCREALADIAEKRAAAQRWRSSIWEAKKKRNGSSSHMDCWTFRGSAIHKDSFTRSLGWCGRNSANT